MVRIEKVLTQVPLASRQRSHRPANANNSPSFNRNRANARKAYDAVVHFGRGANLLPDQESEIRTELEVLKAELQQLGEQI